MSPWRSTIMLGLFQQGWWLLSWLTPVLPSQCRAASA